MLLPKWQPGFYDFSNRFNHRFTASKPSATSASSPQILPRLSPFVRIFARVKRPLLHRLFSGFMALLVLLTSVGLAVQSHTCHSSGLSTAAIVFSAPEHKCPSGTKGAAHQENKAEFKQSCCEFGTHFHKLEAASVSHIKLLLPVPLLAWLPSSFGNILLPSPQLAPAAPWHASDSSPPLRAGRELLTFVCTWQV